MPAMAQEESESAWSVSGNATATSDYIFRGISQTSEKVAFQPSVTVEHESGFYGYVWGSNVDFDEPGDGISFETAASAFADPFALSVHDWIDVGATGGQTLVLVAGYFLLRVAHTVTRSSERMVETE